MYAHNDYITCHNMCKYIDNDASLVMFLNVDSMTYISKRDLTFSVPPKELIELNKQCMKFNT